MTFFTQNQILYKSPIRFVLHNLVFPFLINHLTAPQNNRVIGTAGSYALIHTGCICVTFQLRPACHSVQWSAAAQSAMTTENKTVSGSPVSTATKHLLLNELYIQQANLTQKLHWECGIEQNSRSALEMMDLWHNHKHPDSVRVS